MHPTNLLSKYMYVSSNPTGGFIFVIPYYMYLHVYILKE